MDNLLTLDAFAKIENCTIRKNYQLSIIKLSIKQKAS